MTAKEQTALDEAVSAPADPNKGVNALAEEAIRRAELIVANCNRFKQPRLNQIQKYRDLDAGKIKPKFRQPFNVLLPTFSGAMDTLKAAFNDDLALEFKEQEPADYIAVRKLNTLWDMEFTSVAPTAKFSQKARQDRSNALFSGRGFMMSYATSDPEYRNNFEIYELEDAIFQPTGGSILPLHLYNGRQNIVRTASQLRKGPYDQKQVNELIRLAGSNDFDPSFQGEGVNAQLAKFKAMGLSPENASYVGEPMFQLVELRITMNGVRYYLVFSPWYRIWLRFEKFSDIFTADMDPWLSWATHEDNKNFLSKSFADDMYTVADAIHTLFNQELTNREKKNYQPRGYDPRFFPDVAALDRAQTRPDALVPVTPVEGKSVRDGLFTFETAELGGTINLIQWMQETAGRDVGVTDLSMGGSQNVSKKATVALAEQQALSKRYILRASPYTEAMGEVGKLFIQGCKDHLPAEKALRKLGIEGQDWDRVIRRVDLDLYGDVDIRVVSSTLDMQESQLKQKSKVDTINSIVANPVLAPHINPKWAVSELLRSGAQVDDPTIDIAMDTKNYGNEIEVARAHEAIQAIQVGQKPEPFYGATTLFLQIIHDFTVNNRTSLGDAKYTQLMDYLLAHADIVRENMVRKAQIDARAQAAAGTDSIATPDAAPSAPASPVAPADPLAAASAQMP